MKKSQIAEDDFPEHPFDWDASCADTNNRSLIAWATSQGATLHDIEVQTREGRRGIFATRDIAGGSTIMHIPDRLVFSVDKAFHSALAPAIEASDLIDKNILALLLLHERARGPASPWREYICRLPRAFDTPPWWNDTRLDALAGDRPDLYGYSHYLRGRLRRAWADIVPPLARRHPALFPRRVFGYREWLWAWTAVNSRNFRVAGRPSSRPAGGGSESRTNVMVPVADMFNHRQGDNGTLTVEGPGGAGGFSVQAGPPATAGEEVFLSYGDAVPSPGPAHARQGAF